MTEYIKNNKLVSLIIISAFFLGIIIGAVNADKTDAAHSEQLYNITNECVKSNSLYYAFTTSLSIQFSRFAIFSLCGITVIGSPVAVFYIGYLGYTLGFSSAFLFKYYGMCGILSILGGVIPHYLILIPVYFLIGVISINFSNGLLLEHISIRNDFKGYALKMLFFAVFIFIACIIEGFVSSFFLKIIFGIIK